VNVSARGQSVLQPGIEDVVFLTLRYETGQMAYVHLSWLHPRKERRLTVVCEHKMVEFDDVAPDKLRIYDKGYDRPPQFTHFAEYLTLRDGDVHVPAVPMGEPLQLQLRHFLDCIRDDATPLTSLAGGLRIVAVLEAAQRSLEADGRPVPVLHTSP
jgi:predicted dehydrogenase